LKRTILILMSLAALSGCTAVHETLQPHRELLSPCACEEDATPVNVAALTDRDTGEVRA